MFKSADELRAIYRDKGIGGGKETVAYCRIGERSSHTWFALTSFWDTKTSATTMVPGLSTDALWDRPSKNRSFGSWKDQAWKPPTTLETQSLGPICLGAFSSCEVSKL